MTSALRRSTSPCGKPSACSLDVTCTWPHMAKTRVLDRLLCAKSITIKSLVADQVPASSVCVCMHWCSVGMHVSMMHRKSCHSGPLRASVIHQSIKTQTGCTRCAGAPAARRPCGVLPSPRSATLNRLRCTCALHVGNIRLRYRIVCVTPKPHRSLRTFKVRRRCGGERSRALDVQHAAPSPCRWRAVPSSWARCC